MKKLIGIFASLILALGMSGVAYATWQESLYIEGTVNTGTMDMGWIEVKSWDTDDYAHWGYMDANKNVSDIDCVVSADPNILTVTVTNAYPCIDYYNLVELKNIGTIPVHIYLVPFAADPVVEVDITYYSSYDIHSGGVPITQPPVQIHQGDSIYALIHVHLTQEADMDAIYYFNAEIVAVQWNLPPE